METPNAPMPTVDAEAATLLVACDKILTILSLQGVQLPNRLLRDLSSFCKEKVSFEVPFHVVAAAQWPSTPQSSPDEIIPPILAAMGKQLGVIESTLSLCAEAVKPAEAMDALNAMGQLELALERLAMLMGWPRSTLKMAARLKFDESNPAGIVKH